MTPSTSLARNRFARGARLSLLVGSGNASSWCGPAGLTFVRLQEDAHDRYGNRKHSTDLEPHRNQQQVGFLAVDRPGGP